MPAPIIQIKIEFYICIMPDAKKPSKEEIKELKKLNGKKLDKAKSGEIVRK